MGEPERGRCVFAFDGEAARELPFALSFVVSPSLFPDANGCLLGDAGVAGLGDWPVACLELLLEDRRDSDAATSFATAFVSSGVCLSVFSRGVDSGRFLRGGGAAASISAHKRCVSLMYGPFT